MDKAKLGEYLKRFLNKYGFKNYGTKLFYLELYDCIIILNQSNYNGSAELYFNMIIKECHPEITKITKSVLKDKLIRDIYQSPKIFYRSQRTNYGFDYDLYNILENEFEEKIDEIYNNFLKEFSSGAINGIRKYNEFWNQDPDCVIKLFIDTAEKIGCHDLAGERGHDWFLSDRYLLLFEYGVDVRYVNKNTEKYIMDNVIKYIPKDLNKHSYSKWCNEKCKEIFLVKGKRFFFGWGVPFPFVNGKPLKYYGCKIDKNGKSKLFYLNEDTNENFYLKIIKIDKNDRDNIEYELIKIE